MRELTRRERTKLNSFLSYWNVFDHFSKKRFLTNGDSIYMINDSFTTTLNPLYAGIEVCKIRKHLHPSLSILQLFVDNRCSKQVMINDHAEQLFLYGRDIFGSSIIEHTTDFIANDEVIIINRYRDALGIGKARYDHTKINMNKITINNLIDLGAYLKEDMLNLSI